MHYYWIAFFLGSPPGSTAAGFTVTWRDVAVIPICAIV
jgi:hypothetical protein